MIVTRPVTDLAWIKAVMTHPKIWPYIGDDGAPSVEDFKPPEPGLIQYIGAYRDETALGLFMLVPLNVATVECHTCLLPHAWGPPATICAAAGVAWVWHHTQFHRIISSVPASNRLALRFALRSGFQEYGINPKAWLKNGQLEDVHLVGISRG